MASLSPGVLSKLLEHAGNKNVKVTGEHRSAVLQVIEIIPSFAPQTEDDPWRSRGFFLKVSDSLHSAYVAISNHEDIDLIHSDKIQLGQFVYVTRLYSGSPVPVLRGLRPVPKRRPGPCVGNPTNLVPCNLLPIRAAYDLASNDNADAKAKAKKVKANGNVMPKKSQVEGLELRRLSLDDSSRRLWDQGTIATSRSDTSKAAHTTSHSKSQRTPASSYSASVIFDKKASSKNDSPLKSSSLSISPVKNKINIVSPKSKSRTLKKDPKSLSEGTIPSHLIKVPLNSKMWSDQRIVWNALPSAIHDIGKQVMSHRNVAFLAAIYALEEASAAEGVVHCMCTFADLCNTSQKIPAGVLVEQFLDLHQNMLTAVKLVDSLLSTTLPVAKPSSSRSLQYSSPGAFKSFTNKKALCWVQAAVATNLSSFNLFRMQEKSELVNGEKCHLVIIDSTSEALNCENNSPQEKRSHRCHGSSSVSNTVQKPSPSRRLLSSTKKANTIREEWSKGSSSRLKETATLAEKLLLVSREWFFKYLEESLNMGFASSREEERSEIAYLVGQLKRVNEWLDGVTGGGVEVDERKQELRRKLYGFLLEHVESNVVASK